MEFTTVGSLIKEIRTAKNVTRKELSYGICSEHVLRELESDCYAADVLMLDVFLQRLGQSPDKFEMVLNSALYNMVRLRDLTAEAVYRRKWKLVELLLQNYPLRTHTDEMYQHRMRALLVYRMDANCALAAEHLQRAATSTLPDFTYECFYEQMEQYLISAVELENLLALERMIVEGNIENNTVRRIAKSHLEICMDYIEKHFSGDEEYHKLVSKCAWLIGGICYLDKDYMQAMVFCKKGIEGLRRNTILYFMLPLLELMVRSEAALGIPPERSKWLQHYEILTFLWKGYAKKWYPTDALFHNCYQRDYHLDYELIRAERKSQNMTQAQLAEDIYQNTESLSRVETGKVSPNKKTFEKLMDKLGLDKRMYNGCVVTNSFEVMELKRTIDGFMMRRDFQKAKEATKKLKDVLDLEIPENKMVVRLFEIVTAKRLGEMTAEEALVELRKLAERFMDTYQKTFFHIPMRNEALVINNICITLCEIGNVADALELYRITLEKIKSSKVKVKYRYRS
ncbi:MAG: helix-turn-helix domain-containing protein, partial [Lachnospiraceae bacterium]|nr:helix-turn-helix domain-containing protein [Lachnospiraceae bacterium]